MRLIHNKYLHRKPSTEIIGYHISAKRSLAGNLEQRTLDKNVESI